MKKKAKADGLAEGTYSLWLIERNGAIYSGNNL